MQSAIIFLAIVGSLFFFQYAAAEGLLDRVNVDNYLRNPKLVEYHIQCLVYDGPCDRIANEIKRLLPLVGRQCRGCTEEQKVKLGKIINHWQRNYPQAWRDMLLRVRHY